MNYAADDVLTTSTATRIATDRGPAWEYRLLAQLLADEVDRSRDLLWSPPPGPRACVPLESTAEWLRARCEVMQRLLLELESFMNADYIDAFGPPGRHGNANAIAAIARRVGTMYRQAIEWVHSVRTAEVDPSWRGVAYEVAMFGECLLRPIEEYGPRCLKQIDEALEDTSGRERNIDLTLDVRGDPSRILASLRRLEDATRRGEVVPSSPTDAPGYVYVLTNPSLGGLLKIGRTTRSPHERAGELSSATGIPTPFSLAFDAYVENCVKAEAYVHARLTSGGFRVSENREFFNVDLSTAIKAVLEAQRVVGLDSRSRA